MHLVVALLATDMPINHASMPTNLPAHSTPICSMTAMKDVSGPHCLTGLIKGWAGRRILPKSKGMLL